MELMVAVAVIAVVLVIGVPGIANMKRSSDLTTASKDLVVALNFARAEAVRQGANITVSSKAGDNNSNFKTGWHVKDGSTVVRAFYDIPTSSNVNLFTDSTVFKGTAPVTFAGLGNVTEASCFDITVTDNSEVRSVSISPAGRVTSCNATCEVIKDNTIAGNPTKCD
ncbi:MAG: GspH/FimT family protein [Chromatiaceae bacterium]|nr:GspH/FimT family protein [Chromatiaceae bacterium]MCP5410531.1 GspH/FimT family protein [Chromatiaceae bacterium]MCP5442107.1 GspH/FimT family protein [Chromatiaceae bacterium]